MAEKGIVVADAASGESVACREAVELDDDSNARIIQRVDVCKGTLSSDFLAAGTLIRDSAAGADSKDEDSFVSEGVITTLITVGDKSTLVVAVSSSTNTSSLPKIIPILMDTAGTGMVGFLEEKTCVDLKIQTSGSRYLFPLLTWEVTGAAKIGLMISENSDPYNALNLYGAVI